MENLISLWLQNNTSRIVCADCNQLYYLSILFCPIGKCFCFCRWCRLQEVEDVCATPRRIYKEIIRYIYGNIWHKNKTTIKFIRGTTKRKVNKGNWRTIHYSKSLCFKTILALIFDLKFLAQNYSNTCMTIVFSNTFSTWRLRDFKLHL